MEQFRPFELLKLIRDKSITSIHDIEVLATRSIRNYIGAIEGLIKLGFIYIDTSGKLVTTERFSLFLDTFDISLTQLENYSQNSLVCSPVFGLPSKEFAQADIFMVMPFVENLKPVYEDHIKNVVKKLDLSILRGDDFFSSNAIISDIWNAINSCKIVIADCTGRNPNVFYEIGIAHTIGKPVVFISQNKDDIPFDVKHIRYILYEFTPRGMSEFEEVLTATIENEFRKLESDNLRLILKRIKREFPDR